MVAISIPQPEPADWPPAPSVAPAPRAPRPRGRAPTARKGRPTPDRATRYRRRRLAAVVVVALVVTLGAALAQAASAALSSSGGGSEPRPAAEVGRPLDLQGDVYVVRPGDTLWTIAAALAPDADPRGVVDELRRANGGAALEVGDRLRVDLDDLS